MKSENKRREFAWAGALIVVVVAGTLVTSCMTPFVAIAVMCAATMTPRAGAAAIVAAWAINQALGFALLGFPATLYAAAWGTALLGATLVAFAVAHAARGGAAPIGALRLAGVWLGAFAVYELALFAFALVVGGLDTFTPEIIAMIALNDAIWCVALLGVRVALSAAAPSWFGERLAVRWA